VVGWCTTPVYAPEVWRFQFEGCANFVAGEKREAFVDSRVEREVNIEPEKEEVILELLKQGATSQEIARQVKVGSQKIVKIRALHPYECKVGEESRKERKSNARELFDQRVEEVRRMIGEGASYYSIHQRLGVNRKMVSAYATQEGLG